MVSSDQKERVARSVEKTHEDIQPLELRLRLRSERLDALEIHKIQRPNLGFVPRQV